MKYVLWLTFGCWSMSGLITMFNNDDGYFIRVLGAMMCIGFIGVIEAIQSLKKL